MFAKKIIVEDEDKGYIVATLQAVDQLGSNDPVPLYKYKEYYHSLHSALEAEFNPGKKK